MATPIGRRSVMQAAVGMAASGLGLVQSGTVKAEEQVPYSPAREAGAEGAAEACDCHMHIYDSRFPSPPPRRCGRRTPTSTTTAACSGASARPGPWW